MIISLVLTALISTASPPEGAQVIQDDARGVARAVFGLDEATQGGDEVTRATRFLVKHGDWLGGIRRELVGWERTARIGHRTTVYFQVYHAVSATERLPVWDRFIAVRLDAQQHVRRVQSDFDRWTTEPLSDWLPVEQARATALDLLSAPFAGQPERVLLPMGPGQAVWAWRVPVARIPLRQHFHVFLDARTGNLLKQEGAMKDQPTEHIR
jgi:hypothetical protein